MAIHDFIQDEETLALAVNDVVDGFISDDLTFEFAQRTLANWIRNSYYNQKR